MLHPVLPDIHVFANPTHVKSWHSQQQMLPEHIQNRNIGKMKIEFKKV